MSDRIHCRCNFNHIDCLILWTLPLKIWGISGQRWAINVAQQRALETFHYMIPLLLRNRIGEFHSGLEESRWNSIFGFSIFSSTTYTLVRNFPFSSLHNVSLSIRQSVVAYGHAAPRTIDPRD
jgi:hypothetical protein